YQEFPTHLAYYTEAGLYHENLTTKYSEQELQQLASYLEPSRDELFTYIGLKTLMDRYVVRDYTKTPVELPQERWMVIAITLM
ncbi:ribonucleotide reductase N-terminal alpha domain-containing protein, partial [Lysinibacillus sp. D3C2_S12]|uniref:ribonucleotide reductase N-terminal alpha domain-containing protein n=1 Tax=Lysinibacillus sp. D3C2_S12 TaxID=2941226 RepID=UPI0024BE80B0